MGNPYSFSLCHLDPFSKLLKFENIGCGFGLKLESYYLATSALLVANIFFPCFLVSVSKGIVTGLDNLDSIIDIIRKASNHASAAANLRKGKLICYCCLSFPLRLSYSTISKFV